MAELKNADPLPAPREVTDAGGPIWRAVGGWMTAIGDLIRNRDLEGTGSPEGVYVAKIGTLYRRRDGGVGSALYCKTADNGEATGWSAVA